MIILVLLNPPLPNMQGVIFSLKVKVYNFLWKISSVILVEWTLVVEELGLKIITYFLKYKQVESSEFLKPRV